MCQEKIIRNQDGKESRFTLVPSDKEKSSYARGASCTVFKVIDSNGKFWLIKQYNKDINEYTVQRNRDIGLQIWKHHYETGDNYLSDDYLFGTDEEGALCQVFRLYSQTQTGELFPLSCMCSVSREDLCERLRSLLHAFKGLLSHVARFHEMGYVHCDINLSNVLPFNVNQQMHIQLIDWDSVLQVEKLGTMSAEDIRNYLLTRSSQKMCISGLEGIICTVEDINEFARLDFSDESLGFVWDTTALARLLCFLLFGNSTFLQDSSNELISCYSEYFPQSYLLLKEFFSGALSQRWEDRFTSCSDMSERLDEVIRGLPFSSINYQNAHAELVVEELKKRKKLKKNHGCDSMEDLIKEISFEILPHIQLGERVFVQQGGRSPMEQLMECSHDKALFLYGEGGGGKSTTARHFYYTTLRKKPHDRLVLYYSLTKRDTDAIADYLNNPLRADLQTPRTAAEKPIVLLDALDEAAVTTSTSPDAYQRLFDMLAKYTDRYLLIVTSRTLPPTETRKENATQNREGEKEEEKKKTFTELFRTGRFLELDDAQMRGYLAKVKGVSLEDIRRDSGEELIETLRNPMMLRLFVQIAETDEELKKEALSVTNEVKLMQLYFQKLFRDDFDETYRKGKIDNELYDSIGYTQETFQKECMAIAEATLLSEPVELRPETKRIFSSIITPVSEEVLDARCKEFAETVYWDMFMDYSDEARQRYIEDIENAGISFENRANQRAYEKICTHLRDFVNNTKSRPDKVAKNEELPSIRSFICGITSIHYTFPYNPLISQRILSELRDFNKYYCEDYTRVIDPFVFAHKGFRDYFCAFALSKLFEGLFANLKGNHKADQSQIKKGISRGHEARPGRFPEKLKHFFIPVPYFYFDSQEYRTCESFFQGLDSVLPLSKNEWKYTGIFLGLNSIENKKFAKERVKQFKYLYECYFGQLCTFGREHSVLNDIYRMLCMTYRFFQEDPFEPSAEIPTATGFGTLFFGMEGEEQEERWKKKKTFSASEAYGSRYATVYKVPDGLTRIRPFDYSPNMTTVIFGEDVEWVQPHAFDDCPNLKEIDISNNQNFVQKKGVLFQKNGGYPIWPQPLPNEITVPGEVETIDTSLLSDPILPYGKTEKLVFEEGVQSIWTNIFDNCSKLVHVVLPESLIGFSELHSFRNCPNLKYLTVSPNFFSLLDPMMLRNSGRDDSLAFAPTVIRIYFNGTSREWQKAEKPENFFTDYFPKLQEVVCVKDGVTLTRRGRKTMMS